MRRSKLCFKCHVEKELTDFYPHPKMADGYLGKCKECSKKDSIDYRNANLERIRAYDLARSKLPDRTKKALEINKAWRKADTRRTRCHNAVARALRKGDIEHKACEWPGCSREDSMAHHENYDNPLDVVFYCQPHHKKRHAEMKKQGIIP